MPASGPLPVARLRSSERRSTPDFARFGDGGLVLAAPAGSVATLEGEQLPLAFQPAAVPGQLTGGADDTVAGDDDADRVQAVGQADRPCRGGSSYPVGELATGDGRAARHVTQRGPHPSLERGAGEGMGSNWVRWPAKYPRS